MGLDTPVVYAVNDGL